MEQYDLADIQELTHLCFKSDAYFKNFPQVFKAQNTEHFFLLKDKNKLVCFCTIYPIYFLASHQLLKGYCIGSVCTHPDYRNQGLASQLLQQAEIKAQSLQGNFVYLFSSQNNLYEKAGYQLCGETKIAEVNIKSKLFKFAQKLKSKIFNYKIDYVLEENKPFANNSQLCAQIWSFIVQNSKPSESILSYLEFNDIVKIKDMKIYYLIHHQKLCSVCFLNKGDDFKNVLHGIYYSHVDYATLLIADLLIHEGKNKKFYFFPGVFFNDFSHLFDYQVLPTMYLKMLQENGCAQQDKIFAALNASNFFIRSLQGT